MDGRYIGQSHALGIPAGRYSSGKLAAIVKGSYRTLDEVHDKIPGGFIYAVVNPAWPEWVKVGMTTDPVRRLNDYQTSSPFRDYQMVAFKEVEDRRAAEAELHAELEAFGRREGEWFEVPVDFVVSRLT